MTEMLLYLYAESPIHAGGSGSLDALDLPVQREATTGYPVIWGQSLKGALRQAARDAGWDERREIEPVFGSDVQLQDGEEPRDRATVPGHLQVGDSQLVAMPVPTLRRTFAWVSSQLALTRLERKYRRLVNGAPPDGAKPADGARPVGPPPAVPADRKAAGAAANAAWTGAGGTARPEVLGPCLVELGSQPDEAVTRWAERIAVDLFPDGADYGQLAGKLREDLLVAGSDVMPTLLKECTEFVARVQLTTEKTVAHGPFYSEYLPAETVLAASLTLRPPREGTRSAAEVTADLRRLTELLDGQLHQIGGDETLGKGLAWTRLLGGAA